jgi:hypothetical protein
MSIEHKNTSAASNLNPASPIGDANAEVLPHHPIAIFSRCSPKRNWRS